MKKQFLIAFLMFVQIINGQSVFNSELIKFIENDSLSSSIIGLELMDGKNGKVILEHNANKLLVPASIQKLYTTSYALNILGLNYSFNTTVFTNGEIDDQTLNGDLFISLSGDPSLESRFFDSISFFKNLKNSLIDLNVKAIKGQLILLPEEDDYQVNSQWLWGDLGNYYGGGYSPHTFKDNYVEVFFNSTDSVGEITSINELYPSVSNFTIDNRVVGGVINKDLSYAFGAPYQKERRMNGEIPINKSSYKVKISMHDPKAFLRSSIISELEKSNIYFSNISFPKTNFLDTIFVYSSPKLFELISCVNFKSNNNYAEHLLMKSALTKDSSVLLENAASIMEEYWKEKLDIDNGILFVDGSGLSRKNLSSAHAINQLLFFQLNQTQNETKNSFINSLPTAGLNGTLKYLGKSTKIEGNFIGKSGSMGGVRCYSGYFTKNNNYYPFTIMVNNFLCEDKFIRKQIENLMNNLYNEI